MKTYHFNYERVEIEYTLTRKNVKYINLRVNKKGEVVVSAGKNVPFDVIDEFVRSKADWIILHLAEIEKLRQLLPENELFDEKTVYYLGKPFRLSIQHAEKNELLLQGETITLFTTSPQDQEALRKQYLLWLKQNAEITFEKIMDRVHPLVADYGVLRPTIRIRNMKSRWGSCSPTKGTIRLNLQLMKTPESCIEEVILHELIHFQHPNHSQDFYALLRSLMPDYKERKKEMETNYKDGI